MQTRTSSRFYSFYSRRKPPAAEAVILFISKKMLPALYKGMYNFIQCGENVGLKLGSKLGLEKG